MSQVFVLYIYIIYKKVLQKPKYTLLDLLWSRIKGPCQNSPHHTDASTHLLKDGRSAEICNSSNDIAKYKNYLKDILST